jgi:methylated-DNA-[protein]-cysteine S-methyltransferase
MMKEAIYQFLQTIPAGKVISYKTLADYFETSPRAIGKIMNSNHDPETFPCYKVVKSNGEAGGYN